MLASFSHGFEKKKGHSYLKQALKLGLLSTVMWKEAMSRDTTMKTCTSHSRPSTCVVHREWAKRNPYYLWSHKRQHTSLQWNNIWEKVFTARQSAFKTQHARYIHYIDTRLGVTAEWYSLDWAVWTRRTLQPLQMQSWWPKTYEHFITQLSRQAHLTPKNSS